MALNLSINAAGTQLTVTGLSSYGEYAFRVYYMTPSMSSYATGLRDPTSGNVIVYGTSHVIFDIEQYIGTTPGAYFFEVNVWSENARTNTRIGPVYVYVEQPPTPTYSVYYNQNYGSGGVVRTDTVELDSWFVVRAASSIPLTRPGYTFTGWNTNPDGTGVSYTAGVSYHWTWSYNLTLYAQWQQDITYYYYRVDVYTASGSGAFTLDDRNTYSSTSSSVRISDTWSGYSGYSFVQAYAKSTTYYSASSTVTGLSTSLSSPTVIEVYLRYSLYYYRVAVNIGGSTTTYGPYASTSDEVYVNTLFSNYASSYVFKEAGSSADTLPYGRYDYIDISSSLNDQGRAVTVTLYCRYAKYPLTVYGYIGNTDSEAIASEDPDYTYTNANSTAETGLISNLISLLSSSLASDYYFIRAEYGGNNYYSTSTSITFLSSSSNVVKIRFRRIPRPYVQRVYIDGTLAAESQQMTAYTDALTVSALSYYHTYAQDSRYEFDHAASSRTAGSFPASGSIPLFREQSTTISLYFRSVVVAPSLSVLAHSVTDAIFLWAKNGGTQGSWYLLFDTVPDLSYATSQRHTLTTEGEINVEGLTPGVTYYFAVINRLSSGTTAMSSVIQLGGGGGWGGIDRFDWTYGDSTMITAGQPVTNIQASAWNELISRIGEVRSATGGAYVSVPYAAAGQPITAAAFTAMRNAIAVLAGAGSVASIGGAGTQCLAVHFANASNSLKSAINRAVDYANGY